METESETVKFDQKCSTDHPVDITESPYHVHLASPQPPLLGIDEATVTSGCPDSPGQSETVNAHQQSPDYPVVPQPQHNESTINKRKIDNSRVRWVRLMFWILWLMVIFIWMLGLINNYGYRRSPDSSFALAAVLRELLVTAVTAYAIIGIPCAMIEIIICIFRKRKDSSVRLPISNFIAKFVILILISIGGPLATMLIPGAYQEKGNRIEEDISDQKRNDEKFEQEITSLREVYKSGIDDRQKQLDAVNEGIEIVPEPLEERFEKMREIVDSSDGYRGLAMKSMVEALREMSALGQEYQKASTEVVRPSEHDLQHLYECKKSLTRCKLLMQKLNHITANYREYLEKKIPHSPETIPFKDFDKDLYAVARKASIDGSCKSVTSTFLANYQTEENLFDIMIEEVDFLIETFKDWEISPDGKTLFANQSDLDKLNDIQRRIENEGKRSEELGQKMLDEQREKLEKLEKLGN